MASRNFTKLLRSTVGKKEQFGFHPLVLESQTAYRRGYLKFRRSLTYQSSVGVGSQFTPLRFTAPRTQVPTSYRSFSDSTNGKPPAAENTTNGTMNESMSSKSTSHPFLEEFISAEEFKAKYMPASPDPNKHHFPNIEPPAENLVTVVSHQINTEGSVDTPERFAIADLRGFQYKVAVGDLVVVDRIDAEAYPVGSTMTFDRVLLVGSRNETLIGRPNVVGASVVARVEQHTKDKKLTIFKLRRRKHSKRTQGFRRHLTLLRILEINPGDLTE